MPAETVLRHATWPTADTISAAVNAVEDTTHVLDMLVGKTCPLINWDDPYDKLPDDTPRPSFADVGVLQTLVTVFADEMEMMEMHLGKLRRLRDVASGFASDHEIKRRWIEEGGDGEGA